MIPQKIAPVPGSARMGHDSRDDRPARERTVRVARGGSDHDDVRDDGATGEGRGPDACRGTWESVMLARVRS